MSFERINNNRVRKVRKGKCIKLLELKKLPFLKMSRTTIGFLLIAGLMWENPLLSDFRIEKLVKHLNKADTK